MGYRVKNIQTVCYNGACTVYVSPTLMVFGNICSSENIFGFFFRFLQSWPFNIFQLGYNFSQRHFYYIFSHPCCRKYVWEKTDRKGRTSLK